MKWLVLLAVADVLAVLFFVAPELVNGATLTQVGVGRVLTTTVVPVVVLLVVNVLPPGVKTALVYWKHRNALPGFEAFTKHASADPRIDVEALKKNIGYLPTDPAEQNARWFKLFKQVESVPAVADAHRSYLMYRDMSALSLPLVVFVPLALFSVGATQAAAWLAAGLFLVQYLLTAISARWAGIGFVRNVLAVHSTKKVAASPRRRAKQSSA